MDADLEDVGLSALEAMEAQDAETTDTTNAEDVESEAQDTNETADAEDAGVKENETNDEVGSDEESDETSDEGNQEEDNSDTEEKVEEKEEKEEKKELSDEEFEEMAKKRGYAKAPTEDEQKAAEQKNAVMERLFTRPEEIPEKVWDGLPETNKIIYNSLPYIQAEGKDGETYSVKTPDQLPDDFEFASKKAEAKFYNDLQAQEMKATKMSEALNARIQRTQAEEAQRQEAIRVINEIEELQKSGDLPTPTAKQGSKDFDYDPAVELINKVLNYRETRMKEGLNLSVKDSYLLYKAQHPADFEKKESKGDAERANVAKKIAGSSKASGTPVNNKVKPSYYRPGMTTEDVLDRVLDDME